MKYKVSFEVKYEQCVVRADGCWKWTGSKLTTGYGRMTVGSKTIKAHRFSWEYHNKAKIPEGLMVCHKCDNPECTNPDHLFLGTCADNLKDMADKGRARNQHKEKSHCANGHALTGDNVYYYKDVQRICKTCRRAVDARRESYRIRKKAA